MKVLVTGSTGYVGGRLVPRLLAAGHDVRVLVRDPARVQGKSWSSQVEVVKGDLLLHESLERAFEGVEAAYYLVHSMLAGSDFEKRDREAVRNYVSVAMRHATKTIYMGGLLPHEDDPKGRGLSRHLQSRAEVGAILRESLPTTEFRAGPVIGSGSASFEMLRYLTERLPIMITPRWVTNEVQPIAIRDVLSYLIAALSVPAAGVIDIGADRLTFRRMMEVFAEERKLHRRWFIRVPILAPRLAALWVGWVTPIPNSMAVPIIEGITCSLVADTRKAEKIFPTIRPIPFRAAVRHAMEQTRQFLSETHWSDAFHAPADASKLIKDEEGMVREIRAIHVNAAPEKIFCQFTTLGGQRGWLRWNFAWRIRGLMDRMVGGPGLRRGRRNPYELHTGDAVDFWRVEAVQPPYLLRLHAEMRLPGSAWIEWETHPEGSGGRLVQTAFFSPKGFGGFLYWYALYPFHSVIFRALVREIGKRAEAA